MAKALIVIGLILLLAGLFWPILSRMGLGRLPGDFLFRRDGFTVYLPITTGILISLVMSLLLWLFRK